MLTNVVEILIKQLKMERKDKSFFFRRKKEKTKLTFKGILFQISKSKIYNF